MTHAATLLHSTGSRIYGNLHTSMEYTYLPHLPNSTYIEKETYFLWNDSLTSVSRPDNWRSWTDADYIYNFTPFSKSTTGKAPTITKVTMMAMKENYINPPTHGLTKDTQVQKKVNCGVTP